MRKNSGHWKNPDNFSEKLDFFNGPTKDKEGTEEIVEWHEQIDENKDVRKKYRGKEQKSVDKLIMQKGVDKVQKFHDKNPREFDNMVKKLAMLEEVELDEQKVFVFRYEYKGKRYAAPFKSEKPLIAFLINILFFPSSWISYISIIPLPVPTLM